MSDVLPRDESFVWRDSEWRAVAHAWIEDEVAALGLEIDGEITQPHVQWWSTVLRVPTAAGALWFKASQPSGAFEAPLTMLLAEIWPDETARIIAADTSRGWTLTRDSGVRLRDIEGGPPPVERWAELLPRYAELQLELADRRDQLLDLGVPNLGLAVLPAELETLVDEPDLLMLGETDGLSMAELDLVRAGLDEFAARCRRLSDFGIPESLQHDDLHDGNVFVRNGRYVISDWGDACISHPFHSLVVTLRALAYFKGWGAGGPEVTRLRDAYLEPWHRFGSAADLVAAAELARQTGTIQRSLAWRRAVSMMLPAEFAEHADSIAYGLRLYLKDGPFGTWDDGGS
ncbi:MAG: phosphotransferase [Chloroflexota bacterium]